MVTIIRLLEYADENGHNILESKKENILYCCVMKGLLYGYEF